MARRPSLSRSAELHLSRARRHGRRHSAPVAEARSGPHVIGVTRVPRASRSRLTGGSLRSRLPVRRRHRRAPSRAALRGENTCQSRCSSTLLRTAASLPYNALRVAAALELGGQQVEFLLMGDGVNTAGAGRIPRAAHTSLEPLLAELVEKGAAVTLCGTCCQTRGLQEADLIEGGDGRHDPRLRPRLARQRQGRQLLRRGSRTAKGRGAQRPGPSPLCSSRRATAAARYFAAAPRDSMPAGSFAILTAQTLNSAVMVTGSPSALVSSLTGDSA